ncbi:chromosome segregation protein SMC [Pseudocolwellia agarivorans]|uniref:chromosome segregation protein SMC n=1 Tax=Pseudocolwellia agarivorans TaxID=1911682 RepID=UPI0009868569|nr:chromosome segregation protein SMC [Pseudocolwellia agarivorans]
MRLKHIKLAGFKSFVDPTKVPFEQQMTAIVGPNGCGKSNIIDAVRWVLGESSAKNLRGDSMTDVIFNGSSSRKPIGQASVELVFDNIDGRIQGNMADRNEISIRRLVNRESTNTYFLNGTKCRRRDITDIFLGTGLGPRSYAIIEQGTISRLIESKPHELRIFIEEAAGISKYKERRKDTENRIRHTRENLARLSDIRAELSLQIDKLHKQSEAAKRFRTLKAQERKYKAELSVLRWQTFDQQSKQQQTFYNDAQIDIESIAKIQEEQNIALFQAKQKVELNNESITGFNNKKLELTNHIARTEQNIKHLKQQSTSITQNNDITQQQLLNAQALLKTEQEKRNKLENSLTTILPQLSDVEKKLITEQKTLEGLSTQQNEVQALWNASYQSVAEFKEKTATITNKVELEQQKKSQANEQIESLNNQLLYIDEQHQNNSSNQVDIKESKTIEKSLALSLSKQQQLNQLIQAKQNKTNETKQSLASETASLTALNNNITNIDEQLSRKENWQVEQHACLRGNSLQEKGLVVEGGEQQQNIQTLVEQLSVESGWEKAVESLLLSWSQAEIVDSVSDSILAIKHLDTALLIELNTHINKNPAGSVTEKIKNLPSALSFFQKIYFADNVEQAQKMLPKLGYDESVICMDTTWLGHGFVRKGTIESTPNHLLLLERKEQLTKDISQLEQAINTNKELLVKLELELQELLVEQEQLNTESKTIELSLQNAKQTEALEEQNQQFYLTQQQKIKSDIEFHKQQLINIQQNINQLTEQRNQLVMPADVDFDQLKNQQESLAKQVSVAQKRVNDLAEDRHNIAIKVEQFKNEKDQCKQSVQSVQKTIERLIEQQMSNQHVIDNSAEPLKIDEDKLVQWLKEMSETDSKIEKLQQDIADTQLEVKTLELEQKKNQDNILTLREKSAKFHLDYESFKLRAESSLDLLRETQQSFDEILSNMPKNAKESIWQAHIIRLSKDIERLGAINLAAIDEYETQLTRKEYLDTQNNDLTLAINTLEAAIEKIDKESRQKFKNTFEQVNKDLKSLFPKVFGGGKAYLELTGTDMLDTGVTIMAQPPGKKNSTIHLLSGGEKALTALSLVFAIFRLNPAPFCMLDEVDAPLDDANVSRFCNLVREMSRTVQFIYISHNKIAMEMASHLTGVTMFEPGVSKMVAVDIEEAVAMAEIL